MHYVLHFGHKLNSFYKLDISDKVRENCFLIMLKKNLYRRILLFPLYFKTWNKLASSFKFSFGVSPRLNHMYTTEGSS